jgi:uncharacterized protein with GYD domain
MAFYLLQISYKEDQVRALVANPQDRSEEAAKLIEGLGGKLHQFFFAFGDYDVACIVEVPDNAAMVAGSMAVAAAGTTSAFKTTPLLTMDEAVAAMKKAGELTGYKAPSA